MTAIFIGENIGIKLLVIKAQLLPYKLRGEFTNRFFYYIVKTVMLYHKVVAGAFKPNIAQRHIDILLNLHKFVGKHVKSTSESLEVLM